MVAIVTRLATTRYKMVRALLARACFGIGCAAWLVLSDCRFAVCSLLARMVLCGALLPRIDISPNGWLRSVVMLLLPAVRVAVVRGHRGSAHPHDPAVRSLLLCTAVSVKLCAHCVVCVLCAFSALLGGVLLQRYVALGCMRALHRCFVLPSWVHTAGACCIVDAAFLRWSGRWCAGRTSASGTTSPRRHRLPCCTLHCNLPAIRCFAHASCCFDAGWC